MAEAFYHHGFTIEYDYEPKLQLKVDGKPIPIVARGTRYAVVGLPSSTRRQSLPALGRMMVQHLPGFRNRQVVKVEHEKKVRNGTSGRERWNRWREQCPHVQPLLYRADLRGRDLRGYDFSYANLTEANLRRADLRGANFHAANLGGADLFRAKLNQANFCRTDLYMSKLRRANLTGANLQGTGLVMADFSGAKLSGCRVFGMSAWDVTLDGAKQRRLRIRYRTGRTSRAGAEIGELSVADLETAQLLFFLLRNKNENVGRMLNAMTRQIVLILGRFTPERKAVLDKLRDRLQAKDLIPIVFDFPKPQDRDLTETISTIAHLAKFVIADLTEAKSIPQELARIVPTLPSLPIQPIILSSQRAYSMAVDFGGYRSVLEPFPYKTPDHLLESLDGKIIAPAEKRANEIQQLRQSFEDALFQRVKMRRPRRKRGR